MNYKKIILLTLCLSFIKSKSEDENTQLIIELFRHGARREEPKIIKNLSIYPDPNSSPSDLTAVGYKAHYFLGKAIRQTYKDFIPEKYNYHNIEIYAAPRQRTIQSANAQLLGLFDFGTGPDIENDNSEFYNPPIENFDIEYKDGKSALPNNMSFLPVINQAKDHSTLFNANHICPTLNENVGNYMLEKLNDNKSVFEPLYKDLIENGFLPSLYFNRKTYDIQGGYKVCDIILSRIYSDPDFEIEDKIVDQCELLMLYFAFEMHSKKEYRNTHMTQIYTLLKNVLTQKSNGKKEELKLLLLSGHDTTLSAFAFLFFPNSEKFVLNLYKKKYNKDALKKEELNKEEKGIESIRFTANFVIEVFKKKGESGNRIRIKFNNELLNINKDRSEMLLDDFLNLLENNIDNNFERNCGAYYQHTQIVDYNKYFVAWLITFIILLSLLVVLYVITKNSKRRALEESLVENDEELLI